MILPKSIEFLLPHHEIQRQERVRLFVMDDSGSSSQYWLLVAGSIFCVVALGFHFRKHIPCFSRFVLFRTIKSSFDKPTFYNTVFLTRTFYRHHYFRVTPVATFCTLRMFDPPVTSDLVDHEGAYTEDLENSMQHSFSHSRSTTSTASQLAVLPKDGTRGVRDRQAILTLLRAYRLDDDAVDTLKQNAWEVRLADARCAQSRASYQFYAAGKTARYCGN